MSPPLSFTSSVPYTNEILKTRLLEWGEERELIEKVIARRKAKDIINGVKAIKILKNPGLSCDPEHREAENIERQYRQGKKIEEILREVIPDKMDEVMKMVHTGETNEIIGKKMVESIEPNPWSTFINKPGFKNKRLIEIIIKEKKKAYGGLTNSKAVVSEIINILKKGVKAEKIINKAQEYKNDNEALTKFKTDIKEGEIARNTLNTHYQPITLPFIPRYKDLLEPEEIKKAAAIGLMNAIDKFDYDKGCNFKAYVRKGIEINITTAVKDKIRKSRTGKDIPYDEKEVFHESIQDKPVPSNVESVITKDFETKVPQLLLKLMKLAKLNKREEDVLKAKFGIGGKRNLRELANKYNVSRERIRQIQEKALQKIQEKIKTSRNPGIKELSKVFQN